MDDIPLRDTLSGDYFRVGRAWQRVGDMSLELQRYLQHVYHLLAGMAPEGNRATIAGRLQTDADWKVILTRVGRGASIGSGAVILGGVTIGAGALVGAGAVVTHDVAPDTIVAGVPARLLRDRGSLGTPACQ